MCVRLKPYKSFFFPNDKVGNSESVCSGAEPGAGQVRLQVQACGVCPACRRGDFVNCANVKICGISYDGASMSLNGEL